MWFRIVVFIIFTIKLGTSEDQTISHFDRVKQQIFFLASEQKSQLKFLFKQLIYVLFHFQLFCQNNFSLENSSYFQIFKI